MESAVFHLKQWRAEANRYAKRSASFPAICQIRALVLWTKQFLRHTLEQATQTPPEWLVHFFSPAHGMILSAAARVRVDTLIDGI